MEVLAEALRDRDVARAPMTAWMGPESFVRWKDCPPGFRSQWTEDVRAALRRLREESLGSVFRIEPDGSLVETREP